MNQILFLVFILGKLTRNLINSVSQPSEHSAFCKIPLLPWLTCQCFKGLCYDICCLLKSWTFFFTSIEFQKMVQFCYLRVHSTIETVSCFRLLRMARMDGDWKLKRLGQPFQVLPHCETHKTVNNKNIYRMLLCCAEIASKAWEN